MSLLREKGEEEYALYANPGQEVYKALGMVVTLTNPATAPGYITTGYWSKVAEGKPIIQCPGILYLSLGPN